jgi:hypothetical protein
VCLVSAYCFEVAFVKVKGNAPTRHVATCVGFATHRANGGHWITITHSTAQVVQVQRLIQQQVQLCRAFFHIVVITLLGAALVNIIVLGSVSNGQERISKGCVRKVRPYSGSSP